MKKNNIFSVKQTVKVGIKNSIKTTGYKFLNWFNNL